MKYQLKHRFKNVTFNKLDNAYAYCNRFNLDPSEIESIHSLRDIAKQKAEKRAHAKKNKLDLMKQFNLSAKRLNELMLDYKIQSGIQNSDVQARALTFVEYLKYSV